MNVKKLKEIFTANPQLNRLFHVAGTHIYFQSKTGADEYVSKQKEKPKLKTIERAELFPKEDGKALALPDRTWDRNQIRDWMAQHDLPYKGSDTKAQLVARIQKALAEGLEEKPQAQAQPDELPNDSWTNERIRNWLTARRVEFESRETKAELLHKVAAELARQSEDDTNPDLP